LSLVGVGRSTPSLAVGSGRPARARPPTLPDPPALILPPDGTFTCDHTPLFAWGRVKSAALYRLQVAGDPGFNSPVIDQLTDETSFVPDSALPDGTWYWRVQASNDQLLGAWSVTWSLTLFALAGPPDLLAPLDNSVICDRMPHLEWSPVGGATSYRVQVDDDPGFGSPALDVNASGTGYSVPAELAPGRYYWRVRALNDCEEGAWSTAYSFFVLVRPAPPALLAPPDGERIPSRLPSFSWSLVSGAVSYRIQVDASPDFGQPLIEEEVTTPSFTPGSELPGGTFYWRVQAATICERGDWSETWSLIIRNRAPIANDDRYTFDEDSPDRQLDVLSNDEDPDGDPLKIVHVTQPMFGSVSIAATGLRLIYRPDPDYSGQDSLTYTVDDGYGGIDLARVELTIVEVNDPPVADAGPDQSVPTSSLVTLDGSHSYDPDRNLPLSYFWTQSGGPPVALSSGIVASPTFVSPAEPCTLTFELFVIDALNQANAVPDQVVIAVYSPALHYVYLPTLGNQFVVAPDLVVERLDATAEGISVVVANRGNAAVVDGFFVDLYVDPRSPPQTVNQTWEQLGVQGAVWGVTEPALSALVPGGTVTLWAEDRYYRPDLSTLPGSLPAGTVLYAQVDSYNPDTSYGTVREDHEIVGGAYNNVHGPVQSTAAVSGVGLPRARPVSYLR